MNRRDPAERIWNALKLRAANEARSISQAEAIRRVKAVARSEGAPEIPEQVLEYYAQEYREMIGKKQKSG